MVPLCALQQQQLRAFVLGYSLFLLHSRNRNHLVDHQYFP